MMKKNLLTSTLLAAVLMSSAYATATDVDMDDAARIARARAGGVEGIEALRAELKAKHGVTGWDYYPDLNDKNAFSTHDGIFDMVVKGMPFFDVYYGGVFKGPALDEIYDPNEMSMIYGTRLASMLDKDVLTMSIQGYMGQWNQEAKCFSYKAMPPSALFKRLGQAKKIVPEEIKAASNSHPIKKVNIRFGYTSVSEKEFDADDMVYKTKKLLSSFDQPFNLHLSCEPFLVEPILRATLKHQSRLEYLRVHSYSLSQKDSLLNSVPYEALFGILKSAPNLKAADLGELPFITAKAKGREWQQVIADVFERPQFKLRIGNGIYSFASEHDYHPHQRALFESILAHDHNPDTHVFNASDLLDDGYTAFLPNAEDFEKEQEHILEVQKKAVDSLTFEQAKRKHLSAAHLVITKGTRDN
ncbi:MAG: hypothetical protein ACK5O7_02550 [Holosporales bacterium]